MPKKANMGLMGQCASCRKVRLLNTDSGLCLPCENQSLKERITSLELQLAACRRERAALMEGGRIHGNQ